MTILQWMARTQEKAAELVLICYLYTDGEEYYISLLYGDGWLYRAYPGGRCGLSSNGKRLVEEITGKPL